MLKNLLYATLFLLSGIFTVNAQTPEEKFYLAEEALEFGRFDYAIDLYTQLYGSDPENAHFAYKIGLSYFQSHTKRIESIPFLEKAIKAISYDYENDFDVKTVPSDALFYLGAAYHLNYQLDEALAMLQRFRMILDQKSESDLIKRVNKKIFEIENAQEFVNNPVDVKILNLGDNINTSFPDYSPAISADENTLVFTSRRPGSKGNLKTQDNQYFEDIYISKKVDGEWTKASPIDSINSNGHEASISISADGSQLFVYKDDIQNKITKSRDGNIYVSTNRDDKWTSLKKLPNTINTNEWETHASITADGKTLYFVSNKKGGLGGRDIYKSTKQADGEWGEATNLGATINTEYEEEGPFIHPDGKTLYFSSQSHNSMGGFDIFSSELNTETQTWSVPKNIGYPLNTTDDDVFFVLSPDGKRAYYASSNQNTGLGEKDIYITYLNDAIEKCLVVLKGNFTTEQGNLPENSEITVEDADNELYGIYKPNLRTGEFILILPANSTYTVSFSADNYISENMQVKTSEQNCYQEIEKSVNLPLIDEMPLTLKESRQKLNKLEELTSEDTLDILSFNPKTEIATIEETPFENSEIKNKEKTIVEVVQEPKDIDTIANIIPITKAEVTNNDRESDILDINDRIILKNIFFEYDKSNLKPESIIDLENLFNFLKNNPTITVEIGGYTDSKGSDSYNLALSQKRAEAVVKYQVSKGIAKSRLKAIGYGEANPIAKNTHDDGTDNPEGRKVNRRIELKVMDNNKELDIVEDIIVNPDLKTKTNIINNKTPEEKHTLTKEVANVLSMVDDKIILRNIFFDFDKATLRPESKQELEKLYHYLSNFPKIKVEISGHTDAMGNDAYNKNLSQRRAQSVVDYQIKKGISRNRLIAKGYGETEPIARNSNPDGSDNPEGRQINRRIELRVLKSDNSDLNIVEKIYVGTNSQLTNTETDKKVNDSNQKNNLNYKIDYKSNLIEVKSESNKIPFPVPTTETTRISNFYTLQIATFKNETELNKYKKYFSHLKNAWQYKSEKGVHISEGLFETKEQAEIEMQNLSAIFTNLEVKLIPINALKIKLE